MEGQIRLDRKMLILGVGLGVARGRNHRRRTAGLGLSGDTVWEHWERGRAQSLFVPRIRILHHAFPVNFCHRRQLVQGDKWTH